MKSSLVSKSTPEKVREYYDNGGGADWGNGYLLDEKGYSHNPAVLRLKLVLKLIEEFNCDNIFDAGCADAAAMTVLLTKGKKVCGVDFSKTQVEAGKRRLEKNGFDPNLIDVGDVTCLSKFSDNTFDTILCLGVLPHILNMEDAISELIRIAKRNAILILSFRNDLFDLFTFNSFTLQFLDEHVLSKVECPEVQKQKARELIGALVTHPNEPPLNFSPCQDGFGDLTRINSNPLTIGEDLKPFGLVHIKNGYYKFHPFPPLIGKHFPDFQRWGAQLDEKLCFSWEGVFLASTFVSVFRKV